MTGPEHYLAAEHALTNASQADGDSASEVYYLEEAHVHAMLAVAAASLVGQPDAGAGWLDIIRPGWRSDADLNSPGMP